MLEEVRLALLFCRTVLLVMFSFDFSSAEVTYTVQNNGGNGFIVSFQKQTRQRRVVVQDNSQTVPPRTVREEVPVMQTTPRTTRNPSDGSRTQAIETRGGEAATQVCGGYIEITNMNGQCNELEYDKDFLQLIQTDGLACARSAAVAAFGFQPTKIKFRTGEGQVSLNRRSSNGKVSTHSVGRALDVFEVDIYNGSAHSSVKMHKSYMDRRGHRTFYTHFGDCWKKTVEAAKAVGAAGSCGSGCLDFNYNSAHWDHMHISLPPTDRNRAAHKINCT